LREKQPGNLRALRRSYKEEKKNKRENKRKKETGKGEEKRMIWAEKKAVSAIFAN